MINNLAFFLLQTNKKQKQMDFEAIVVDNGSSEIKAGFSAEDAPKITIPSVVGLPNEIIASLTGTSNRKEKAAYVGQEAFDAEVRELLTTTSPIQYGQIVNFDAMIVIWRYLFDKLNVNIETYPIILTEMPLNSKENRERMTEIMFEKLKVKQMYIACAPVLALYASGKTTGVVVDSGDGLTHVLPVYEGFAFSHAITRLSIAGSEVTKYLTKILADNGCAFDNLDEIGKQQIIKDIKEKLCYVANDYDECTEIAKNIPDKQKYYYELPDGKLLKVEEDIRFQAPEVMFNPELVGLEEGGIQDTISSCLELCSGRYNNHKYKRSIVLSGGNTCFPGFGERLQTELNKFETDETLTVVCPPERKNSAWIGGSLLASLRTVQKMWVTEPEYYEEGKGNPSIIHQKCF